MSTPIHHINQAFWRRVLFFLLLCTGIRAHAQTDSTGRHRIAVFLPLYLDSAFDASGNYRYDKSFPKFINPGLEFYEGASLAIDSLQADTVKLDIRFYDTRSATQSISQIVQSPDFQQTELIIGLVQIGELQQLAAVAKTMKIPFINVNFPNDGGITDNPDMVILNSTLKTHCEGLYKFIQRNWATSAIYVFTKNGTQEDRLKSYFTDIEKTTRSVPLRLKYITLPDNNITADQLMPYLDSNRKTICIAGSLDDNFGRNLCAALASVNKTYTTKIFGMPTWDNIDFTSTSYADQEIYYTTPFYMNANDSLVTSIQNYFRTKFYSRPSDMVFRGYETIFRFGRLLHVYGRTLDGNIGVKRFTVFNDFDIEPVFLNPQHMTLDYFENKKLYVVKKVNGVVVAAY